MPYTPDPVLELYIIEPGSEDDTWGEKLNTNSQRLAEAAHGRVVRQFLPGQTSYTLDDTDFTGTESHKALLQPYGTITSDIEIIVPPRPHIWHVFNGVSVSPAGSPWKVRIKTAVSGAPNVALDAGEHAVLFATADDGGVYRIFRANDFLHVSGALALQGTLNANNNNIINLPHPATPTTYNAAPVKWVADYVESRLAAVRMEERNIAHPVNSFVLNFDGANPATYLGIGSWVLFGGGTLLASAGVHTDPSGFTLNISGAAEKPALGWYQTTLAQANLPPANIETRNPGDNTGGFAFVESTSAGGGGITTLNLGSAAPFWNLPPISVIYVWRRVA